MVINTHVSHSLFETYMAQYYFCTDTWIVW
jgi:hypothetical protein